jgi:hypothetical protein
VSVGALQNTEKRTFALSVEVLPQQAPVSPNTPKAAAAGSFGVGNKR